MSDFKWAGNCLPSLHQVEGDGLCQLQLRTKVRLADTLLPIWPKLMHLSPAQMKVYAGKYPEQCQLQKDVQNGILGTQRKRLQEGLLYNI